MVFHIRDFTDSESDAEAEAEAAATTSHRSPPDDDDDESDGQSAAAAPREIGQARGAEVKPASATASSSHPLRITLRPSLNHLINDDASPSKKKATPIDRSSLSPPPPITLKLGMKHALAEKASYSSSEDEGGPSTPHRASPVPAKKSKKSSGKGKSRAQPTFKGGHTPLASLPATHRKSYDWLQPSSASASHHGPPDRSGTNAESKGAGSSAADDAIGGLLDLSEERTEKPKKSHKKRPADAPLGPGKAWRKGHGQGQKKGPTGQVKEEAGPSAVATGNATHAEPTYIPVSRGATPEIIQMQRIASDQGSGSTVPPPLLPQRAPSPPFIPADAEKLGFPVFSKPIVPPRIGLGPFPKVTQYFAPVNGGDVGPFPRKEKVRNWTQEETVIRGIGNGQLKIKSWTRGPPSELGRLIQADKEAREAARQAKIRATAAANAANAVAEAAQSQSQPESPNLDASARPPLLPTLSYDSASVSMSGTPLLGPTAVGGEREDDDIEMSEMGDEEGSVAGGAGSSALAPAPAPASTAAPAVAAVSAAKAKSKSKPKPKSKGTSTGAGAGAAAGPRKSKLAQEIVIDPEEGSEEHTPTPAIAG